MSNMLDNLNLFKLDYDHFSFIRHNKNSSSKNWLHKKGSKFKTETKTLFKSQNEYILLFSVFVCIVCDVCFNAKNCWIRLYIFTQLGQAICAYLCAHHFEENSFIYFAWAALIKSQSKYKIINELLLLCFETVSVASSWFDLLKNLMYNFIQESEKWNFWNSENDFLNKTNVK